MVKAEHLAASQNELGENPVWNDLEKALFWVDICGRGFFRMALDSATIEAIALDTNVTSLGFRRSEGYIVAAEGQIALLAPEGGRLHYLPSTEVNQETVRYNDGSVGPGGRYWAGTMDRVRGQFQGCFYRVDPDGTRTVIETGIGSSNGIGWSSDHRTI